MSNAILIDTNNKVANYLAIKDEKVVEVYNKVIEKNLTNFLVSSFKEFINKNFYSLKKVNTIYFVNGPGSFTNIRLANIMIKTLVTLNPNLELMAIDRLAFLADYNINEVVVCESSSTSKFVFIHKKNEVLVQTSLVSNEQYSQLLTKYSDFTVRDISNFSFQDNVTDITNLNLDFFHKITDLSTFEAGYYKEPNIDKNSQFNKKL